MDQEIEIKYFSSRPGTTPRDKRLFDRWYRALTVQSETIENTVADIQQQQQLCAQSLLQEADLTPLFCEACAGGIDEINSLIDERWSLQTAAWAVRLSLYNS